MFLRKWGGGPATAGLLSQASHRSGEAMTRATIRSNVAPQRLVTRSHWAACCKKWKPTHFRRELKNANLARAITRASSWDFHSGSALWRLTHMEVSPNENAVG